ncbi:uncharacterized protein BXZ73DRAFT_103676 [Epithele typhae]|uniref:uncharacterized protein n=1 Tax=Epithele typhae TaxID=378194 RepID=UPI00200729CC|nr:uncharacterized protein BXZ73DRAFT_103676 [Epithele typhae]KAH9923942.1 hypothetical protein BXZ73DRAFT_103676 [Epithele typhae]
MSLNDTSLGPSRGVDIHPGVANPTSHSNHGDPLASNFVTDPTTDDMGAGAGPNFQGHKQAARGFTENAGVCEGRPGVIESTHIDPLAEDSNDDDGWAKTKPTQGQPRSGMTGVAQGAYSTASDMATGAASMASGLGQAAYQYVAGDEKTRKSGKEQSA